MSGITATSYNIESAQERETRERREAWTEYAACRAELSALRAEADGYRDVLGKQVGKIPAGHRVSKEASATRIREATEQTRGLVTESRQQLRASVAKATRANVLRSAPTSATTSPTAAIPAETIRTHVPTARRSAADIERDRQAREKSQQVKEKLAQRAGELLARLPVHAPAGTRADCGRVVEEIMATPSEARAQLLLSDLGDTVRDAERADEEVRRTGAALAALAARLDFVATEDADTLRVAVGRLIRERARAVPDGLAQRVGATVAAADRAHRRRMAAAAMRLSLDELGYTVAEGFETVLVDRGAAYANLPDRPGYGVKVLLDNGKDVIRTQVVRSDQAAGNDAEDEASERKFCDAYPTLLRRLQVHGVDTAESATVAPGQHRLATVAGAELPATTGTVAQRSAYQAREMGR